ncbi:Hydroxylaminobenzene mutase HabB [Stanieria sp. NIES-3757]|nr:Hydroxylaminobenzene mutase HabB [Stanieria sp. NIES-3757]
MKVITFRLSIYGTFANWLATLLSAIWGAGALSMPIASQLYLGTEIQEILIKSLLLSLSVAMVFVCIFAIWGLRTNGNSKFQFNKPDQTDLSVS